MDSPEFRRRRKELQEHRAAACRDALNIFAREIGAARQEQARIYERRHERQRAARSVYQHELDALRRELASQPQIDDSIYNR